MKFFRFGEAGREKPGVLLGDGEALDLSGFGADFDEAFFERGGIAELVPWIDAHRAELPRLDPSKVRYGSCVARPSKIVCVGLNYKSHAAEMKAELPKEPKLFMKATTALCGVSDPLIVPRGSVALDYEVELALIIGKRCSYASAAEARSFIAGYTMMNDYSEREFQKNREGQWVKGKSADSFAPLGPYWVPEPEFDPFAAPLFLEVNDELRQSSSTSDLIFDVGEIVSSISQYMTLLPGDVISTGTPGGVGMGFVPPRYLKPGDKVRYGIEGIGVAVQTVVPAP